MASTHPQDDDEQLQAQLQCELERITVHLAYSCRNVLAAFQRRRIAVIGVLTKAENDQLFRRDGFISTEEAASIMAYLKEVWEAFECTNRDVARPLQLAQRASRRLLDISAGLRHYDAANDVDVDEDETQRRMNGSQKSNFWSRIAYRIRIGSPSQVERLALRQAQIAKDQLDNTIKYWNAAREFAKNRMDMAKEKLKLALHALQAAFDRSEASCPELMDLANDLRQISKSIDQETLASFQGAVLILSLIRKSVIDETDAASYM